MVIPGRGGLLGPFVFLPAAPIGDRWLACALTLGVPLGDLADAVTHCAVHHWQVQGVWLRKCTRWNTLRDQPDQRVELDMSGTH